MSREVPFEAQGKTWTLEFSTNTVSAMEEKLDLSLTEIGERMGKSMRIGFIRTLVWWGLRKHHKATTLDDAGDLIDDLGLHEAGAKIGDAFKAAYPKDVVAGDAEDGDAGDPPAKAGTGTTSAASGSSSD